MHNYLQKSRFILNSDHSLFSEVIVTNFDTIVRDYRVREEKIQQQNNELCCKIDAIKTAVKKVLGM